MMPSPVVEVGGGAGHPATWLPRLHQILDRVEAMGPSETGALVIGPRDAPLGTVLIELGRVCWAATPRLRRRLTDLLLERTAHPLERALMEATFRRCRREGKPLGEVLVAAEMVTRDRLREALFLHSSEALVQMVATESEEIGFIRHHNARYAAEFTFTPLDMLCGVGRVVTSTTQPDSEPAWLDEFDGHLATAIFVHHPDDPRTLVPLHVSSEVPLAARDVADLGIAADGLLHGSIVEVIGGRTGAFIGPHGATAVAFEHEGCVVVVLCADGSSASRIFTRRVSVV